MSAPAPPDVDPVAAAIRDLRAGRIVGLPTDTVYGLAAALDQPAGIAGLFALKGRPDGRPLPVLLAGPDALRLVSPPLPDRVMAFLAALWPGGLTVALPALDWLPPAVVAPDRTVGVRVPDHAVTVAVLRGLGGAAAVTSANRSGDPPLRSASEVRAEFGPGIGTVLDDGERPASPPSTVVGFDGESLLVLRPGVVGKAVLQEAWDAAGRSTAAGSGR